MIISEDRLSHLAHLIVDGLYHDDLVDYADDGTALNCVKRALQEFVQSHEKLDRKVRGMIQSLQRTVIEGSPEWDVMYQKYYEQESQRLGNS